MKKILIILLFIFPFVGFSQGITFNLAGLYGFNFKHPGVHARIYYLVNEHICLGPEFSYFIPKIESRNQQDVITSLYEFNFNAHYQFEITEHLGIYPIFGYNYSIEVEKEGQQITNHAASGLNFGAGFHIPLKYITLFAEYNYVFSFGNLDDHVLILGAFYLLKLGKDKHEKAH